MLKSELLDAKPSKASQLAQTFMNFEHRVTPGHVLDRLVDYATDSEVPTFFRNLRDQTVANPLA